MPLLERKLTPRSIGLSLQPADAIVTRREVKADLGLTESVDRLHRVTDCEKRAPVTVLPAGGQCFQQAILAAGGVLEFVDQQVLQAVVEGQRKVGGVLRTAQRSACAHLDLGEVDLTAVPEHQLKFGRRMQQHAEQTGKHGALLVVETVMRQEAQASPKRCKLRVGRRSVHTTP